MVHKSDIVRMTFVVHDDNALGVDVTPLKTSTIQFFFGYDDVLPSDVVEPELCILYRFGASNFVEFWFVYS